VAASALHRRRPEHAWADAAERCADRSGQAAGGARARGARVDRSKNKVLSLYFPPHLGSQTLAVRGIMNRTFYTAFVSLGRFIFPRTMRLHVIRGDVPDQQQGGYVLALTHIGNIDPICSCVIVKRQIRWMTRREFFRIRPIAWLLYRVGAFSVNRQ